MAASHVLLLIGYPEVQTSISQSAHLSKIAIHSMKQQLNSQGNLHV